MKHVFLAIGVAAVLAGSQATAADAPAEGAWAVKRQIISCMSRRMSASRTVSYNDAKKACVAQLKPQSDSPAHLTAAR